MTAFPLGTVDNTKPWTGAPAATISYTANALDSNNRSVYTFTGLSIGAASSSRIVAVVACASNGITGEYSNITIGGIQATKLASYYDSNILNAMAIWYAAVPTGTTATVVVTCPMTVGRCQVAVYRIIPGYSSTPQSSTQGLTSTATQSEINGGVSIYAYMRPGSTDYTIKRNGSTLTPNLNSTFGKFDLFKIGNLALSSSINVKSDATYTADFNDGSILTAHWR